MTNQPAAAEPDDGTTMPDPEQTGTEHDAATEPGTAAPAPLESDTPQWSPADLPTADDSPVNDDTINDQPVSAPGSSAPPLGYPGLSPQYQQPQYPPPGYAAPPPGYAAPPPGYTPPPPGYPTGSGAGFPPPGGFPPPPPGTGGWATRFGLARPTQGRMLAGVCAAIGRTTNTDPVLWRVLFAVLTLVGGFGALAYVFCWLIIPAEGDTGSPIEALVGRGRSSTSPILVIVAGILAVVALTGTFYTGNGVRSGALVLVVVLGAIIFVSRGTNRSTGSAPFSGAPMPPGPMPPGPMPSGPGSTTSNAAGPGTAAPGEAEPDTAGTDAAGSMPAGPGTPGSTAGQPESPLPGNLTPGAIESAPSTGVEDTATMSGPPAAAMGAMGMPGPVTTAPLPGGYRPPFAPHGPYASTTPYPYPGLVGGPPPVPPKPPAPRRPPSRLGRFIFSALLFVLGILAIIDVAGGSIPFAGYLAAALAVLGLGLIAGGWFGRARWFIPIGLLLVVVLAATTALQGAHLWPINKQGGDITWVPATVADLNSTYNTSFGNATLDLSQLKFTNADNRSVTVRATAGNLTVLLPSNVDTTVLGKVSAGNGQIFGERWSGLGKAQHDVTNYGADGPGGGHLMLDLQLGAGNLEVHR